MPSAPPARLGNSYQPDLDPHAGEEASFAAATLRPSPARTQPAEAPPTQIQPHPAPCRCTTPWGCWRGRAAHRPARHGPPPHAARPRPDDGRLPRQSCAWRCELGYQPSAGACTACPPLPAGAGWDGAAVARPCAYRCDAGLYGHPVYSGICVACSVLMGSVAVPRPALPANAAWLDDAEGCDEDTWACRAGFAVRVPSPGAAPVCCPAAPVAHAGANSNAPRGLCGVACDSGYYWEAGAWACSPCPGPPPPAGQAWGDNCSVVFDCGSYASRMGLAVPAHAHWPPAATSPAQCVWACDAGHELAGGGSLCCSTAVPGYGVAGWERVPGRCALRCKAGLFNATAGGPCVPCAQYLKGFGVDICQRWGAETG
jgi:hypothetical protein